MVGRAGAADARALGVPSAPIVDGGTLVTARRDAPPARGPPPGSTTRGAPTPSRREGAEVAISPLTTGGAPTVGGSTARGVVATGAPASTTDSGGRTPVASEGALPRVRADGRTADAPTARPRGVVVPRSPPTTSGAAPGLADRGGPTATSRGVTDGAGTTSRADGVLAGDAPPLGDTAVAARAGVEARGIGASGGAGCATGKGGGNGARGTGAGVARRERRTFGVRASRAERVGGVEPAASVGRA